MYDAKTWIWFAILAGEVLTMRRVQPGQKMQSRKIVCQRWERRWAMWTQLSMFFAAIGLPVFPALVLWLLRRRVSALVDDHGRECLNVQLSNLIIGLAGLALPGCGIGILFTIMAVMLAVWSAIAGAIAAQRGEIYRAPMTLRLVTAARIPAGLIAPSNGV